MLRISYARWEAIEPGGEDAAVPDSNGANFCRGIFRPAGNMRCKDEEALIPVLRGTWWAKVIHQGLS